MVCLFCPCLELNNSLVSHSDGCTQRKFAHGRTGAECHQKYLWSLCFPPVVLRRNAFNFIPINSHEHSILSQSQQNTSLSLSLSLWDDWFNVRLNGKLCGSPAWPVISSPPPSFENRENWYWAQDIFVPLLAVLVYGSFMSNKTEKRLWEMSM